MEHIMHDPMPCTALLPCIDASGERGTARSVVRGDATRGARRLPRRRADCGLRLGPAAQRLRLALPRHAFLDPRRWRRRSGAVGRAAVEQAEHLPAAIQAGAAPTERPGAHGDGRGGGGGGSDVYGAQRGPPPDAARGCEDAPRLRQPGSCCALVRAPLSSKGISLARREVNIPVRRVPPRAAGFRAGRWLRQLGAPPPSRWVGRRLGRGDELHEQVLRKGKHGPRDREGGSPARGRCRRRASSPEDRGPEGRGRGCCCGRRRGRSLCLAGVARPHGFAVLWPSEAR
mmetsp:Transcript_27532/g.65617  ORF Transcript_27532/g.65617 Transcript_27532/m.65617 type:complete len:287 (-) Transcript_27532:583-1443(-)